MRFSIVKRYPLIVVLIFSYTALFSQNSKSENVLEQAITSKDQSQIRVNMNKDFPSSNLYKLADLPLTTMAQNWSIEFDENKKQPHHYFQASLYQNHEQVEALYEDNGRLISSKVREHFIDSPREIKNTVSSMYRGWSIKPIMEKIDFELAHQKIIYYVEIVKGHHSKKIALDLNGSVLKEYELM